MAPHNIKIVIVAVLLLVAAAESSAQRAAVRAVTGALGAPTLIAHWTLGTGSVTGATVADASGNNNTATVVGGPLTGGTFGQVFNGTSQYLNSPYAATTSGLTVMAWVKPSVFSGGPRVISNSHTDSDNRGFQLVLTGDVAEFWAGTGSTNASAVITQTFSTNIWYHLAGVYDGSRARIYVNGSITAQSSGTLSGNLASGTGPNINVARLTTGVDYFAGEIGDVRVYSRGLAAGEIQSIYNAGGPPVTSGVRGRPHIANGTIVADNGQLLRAVATRIDAGSDGNNFCSNYYCNLAWWHDMHDNGHMNTVRFAAYLTWGAGSDRTNTNSMSNVITRIDQALASASQVGMYLVIDNHSFPGPGGAGDDPPDWTENQTFWTTIADRYKNNTNVIYEIQNEPDGDTNIAGHTITSYNLIRSLAPNTPIITNSFNCNGGLSIIQAEAAGGIDYSTVAVSGFHPYCDANISNEIAISQSIQAAGFPVVMTEFDPGTGGPDLSYPNALENAGISWFYWVPNYAGLNITWPVD